MISLRSKVTKSLLAYYFMHEFDSIFINELCRRLNVDKRHLVVKLKELESEGLLKSEFIGNQRYYSLNKKYPLYKEYKKIVLKTIGFEALLKETLSSIKSITKALIFGSYARDNMDASSDIDILVVGNHDTITLQKTLIKLQKTLDREINLVSITQKEFARRKSARDPFILDVLSNKNIEVL